MKKITKVKQETKQPIERVIPLLEPVRVYTAKELAVMPLSQMNSCIEAQEKYAVLEQTTQMGGGCDNGSAFNGAGNFSHPCQRKISNALQNCWQVLSTTNYSAVGKAWIGQFGWGVVL